jgi:hypothetical protein
MQSILHWTPTFCDGGEYSECASSEGGSVYWECASSEGGSVYWMCIGSVLVVRVESVLVVRVGTRTDSEGSK